MNTPIYDFITKYSNSGISRFHMPGHKGKNLLGCEHLDITEIKGADVLTKADGIIHKSEKNATKIFETGATFYSTEGSSLCIKAMLYTLLLSAPKSKRKVIAVRNVHKSFIYACAELDLEIIWIYPENSDLLCTGTASVDEIKHAVENHPDSLAVFLASPNYLGQITDIKALGDICHFAGIPLVVDNAHGAYLKFINQHPIQLGADMCCDSAHKTLPVLTGGAYIHISKEKKYMYEHLIKYSISAFASTSPSYLILASLDLCNKYLKDDYENKLYNCINVINSLKTKLTDYGYNLINGEPLKITILTNGEALADVLRDNGIECEYSDKTCLVIMISPDNSDSDLSKLENVLLKFKPAPPLSSPKFRSTSHAMSVRQAFLSPFKTVAIDFSEGLICAEPCISCPPAVPVVVSGEIITKEAINLLKFYGHKTINAISE